MTSETARGWVNRRSGDDEKSPKSTRAQDVYFHIRNDIIKGALTPGQPLRLEALRERYGHSYSPLREALQRLETERLVDLSAMRGFRVTEISLEQMWDSIRTRLLIENEGIRLSIERGGDEWEVAILGAFHSMTRLATRLENSSTDDQDAQEDQLELRHWQFHSALFSACNSDWIQHIADRLYMQTERYRRPVLRKSADGDFGGRDLVNEHRNLMECVLDRDAKAAAAQLEEHYCKTGNFLEKLFSSSRTKKEPTAAPPRRLARNP